MALNAYLMVTGETQGQIKGVCKQAGREDLMEIYGFSHEVIAPRDAASGMPTGKRQHKPIVVTKAIDCATPLLMNVLTNNENITEAKIDFWHPSRSGKEFLFYTIEFFNGSIAGIRAEQLNNKYAENMKHEVREHVSFCYERIIWTWSDGGVSAEDDWQKPVG